MLNKHNLKINNIKKTISEMRDCDLLREHFQVNYDLESGNVWCDLCEQNSWTEYSEENIITVCNCSQKPSMQELCDKVYDAVIAHVEAQEDFKKMNEVYESYGESYLKDVQDFLGNLNEEEEIND